MSGQDDDRNIAPTASASPFWAYLSVVTVAGLALLASQVAQLTASDFSLMRAALIVPDGSVNLAGYDPDARPLAPTAGKAAGKKAAREKAAKKGAKTSVSDALVTDTEHLRGQQERLWAEATGGSRRAVLLVLQGIDTAGKGGVTQHVVGSFGAIGVQYTAFKTPTPEEAAHHFLWRIRRRLPEPELRTVDGVLQLH